MNKYHQEILNQIKSLSKNKKPDREGFGLKYVGTDKPSYHLNTASIYQIVKEFLDNHKDISEANLVALVDSLYEGRTFDEIVIAAKIVGKSRKLREFVEIDHIDTWLGHVHGWAETDVLCQNAFTDTDFLGRWDLWEKFLDRLVKDGNVHKRRASLVLLNNPLRLSPDNRLSVKAFQNVDLLKKEKDILITKSISWILRTLIKFHREEVSKYIEENRESLPKIAIREVKTKLETGKKYINPKSKR